MWTTEMNQQKVKSRVSTKKKETLASFSFVKIVYLQIAAESHVNHKLSAKI